MKIGQWRIGRGSYGQMRPKSTGLGLLGGLYLEAEGEPLSDRTTTPTVKHGGGNNLMV